MVLIGTHRTATGTIWEPLKKCLLQPYGLWTPSREQALTDHTAEEATRQQAADRAGTAERLAQQQRLRGQQRSGGGSVGGSAGSSTSRLAFGRRSEAQVQEFQARIEQVSNDPANEARRQRAKEQQREKERRRAFQRAFNGERWW